MRVFIRVALSARGQTFHPCTYGAFLSAAQRPCLTFQARAEIFLEEWNEWCLLHSILILQYDFPPFCSLAMLFILSYFSISFCSVLHFSPPDLGFKMIPKFWFRMISTSFQHIPQLAYKKNLIGPSVFFLGGGEQQRCVMFCYQCSETLLCCRWREPWHLWRTASAKDCIQKQKWEK